jgi:hypothetical protein
VSLLLALTAEVAPPAAAGNPMYGGPRHRSKHAKPTKWVWLPVYEEDDEERLEEAAQIIVDVVADGGSKTDAKTALRPVMADIPAFDWAGYYDAAFNAAASLQSRKLASQTALVDAIFKRIREVERLRQQMDEEDIEVLLMYGLQ